MSSQEAVDYAAEYIQQRKQQVDSTSASSRSSSRSGPWWSRWLPVRSTAAESAVSSRSQASSAAWPSVSSWLVSRALLHASEKHIGRRHTEADNLLWIARLPLAERRAVHDDCTVLVVHLAHGGSSHGDSASSAVAVQSGVADRQQSHIQSKL